MIRETAGETALELAAKRLERAVSALEQRLQGRASERGDLFDREESSGGDLAAELERARTRERELEAAGAEASAALGRAISEIRAALNGAGAGGG
jgi:molybdopterin converting factor small subunit